MMGKTSRSTHAELEARLSRMVSSLDPSLTGPVQVLTTSKETGGQRCQIGAQRLIPVSPEAAQLKDIYVAIPVSGWVEIGDDGTLARASLPDPDPETVREARAFAMGLIEGGCVRDLGSTASPRVGGRPTHELQTDAAGRRVLRRIGFVST
jgi:hypothetical protein